MNAPHPSLADRILPVFQFVERHAISVRASAERVLDCVEAYDDRSDGLVKAFIAIREAPSRLGAALGLRQTLKSTRPFGLDNFTRLGRENGQIAFGLIGHFWRSDYGLVRIADAAEFADCDSADAARLVLSFTAVDHAGETRLVTETRVFCPTRRSRLLFTPYWLAIRPVSGLIRRRILRSIKTSAEAEQRHAVLHS